MNPIWEQNNVRGIGYNFDDLIARFIEICREHKSTGRAKSFAFIFYDIQNEALWKMLDNRDGFTHLDRLSGKDLTVFYLDYKSRNIVTRFNNTFAQLFDIPANVKLPYILFFSIKDDDAVDISITKLTQIEPAFVFHELHTIIQNHISPEERAEEHHEKKGPRMKVIFRTIKKIAFEKFIEYLITTGGDAAGHFLK